MNKPGHLLAGLVLLLIACGVMWWMLPVHFINQEAGKQIIKITIYNNNSGNHFEIIDSDKVNTLINAINQVPFRKTSIASADLAGWYDLSFVSANGDLVESLTIQNNSIVKKEITENTALFFSCNFQLKDILSLLESAEATLFPDFHRDPDFSGF